jgi:hypothetical protein
MMENTECFEQVRCALSAPGIPRFTVPVSASQFSSSYFMEFDRGSFSNYPVSSRKFAPEYT